MTAYDWVKVISAVLVANALTGWFLYCAYRVTRNEKAGTVPSRGPIIYLIGLIIPLAIAGFGAYIVKV